VFAPKSGTVRDMLQNIGNAWFRVSGCVIHHISSVFVWTIILILFFEKNLPLTRPPATPPGAGGKLADWSRAQLPTKLAGVGRHGARVSARELASGQGGAPHRQGEARMTAAWQSHTSPVVPSPCPNSRSPWSTDYSRHQTTQSTANEFTSVKTMSSQANFSTYCTSSASIF
jgi:hypothetical protein